MKFDMSLQRMEFLPFFGFFGVFEKKNVRLLHALSRSFMDWTARKLSMEEESRKFSIFYSRCPGTIGCPSMKDVEESKKRRKEIASVKTGSKSIKFTIVFFILVIAFSLSFLLLQIMLCARSANEKKKTN